MATSTFTHRYESGDGGCIETAEAGGVIAARYALGMPIVVGEVSTLAVAGLSPLLEFVPCPPPPNRARPVNVDTNMTTGARIRATTYITRTTPCGPQLLVFGYSARPEAGTHLPGGGIEPGERPDVAAVRESIEETGITGSLELRGVVGVASNEPRDTWTHTMIGDDDAWDTGLEVACRFVHLADAAPLLRTSWHRQEEFLDLLDAG